MVTRGTDAVDNLGASSKMLAEWRFFERLRESLEPVCGRLGQRARGDLGVGAAGGQVDAQAVADHVTEALVERVGEEMLMADFEALSVETVSILAAHTTSIAPSSGLQSHPGAPAIIPVTRRNRTTSSSESGTTACLRGTERSVR